jgi:hypothetical protein
MKIEKYLILIFLFSTICLFAQPDSTKNKFIDNIYISSQFGKGLAVAHRSSLQPLVKEYPSLLHIEIGKTTYGNKSWQNLYNYPSLGIGYYRSTLGNREILGTCNSLYGFIETPYYTERKITLQYKFGFGLAYLDKTYNLDNNIYNSAIGSHINFFVHLSFDAKINLYNKKWYLKTGIGLTHMSNGKTQTPNLGLNLIDFHINTCYYFGDRINNIPKKKHYRKPHTFIGIITGGFKEFSAPNLGKYFAGSTIIEYEYAIKNKLSVGTGFDCFYDGVLHKTFKNENDPSALRHAIRTGIHAGITYYFGDVGFVLQVGSYIKPYYQDISPIYKRFGLRAKINKHLIANLSLKTHWAKADIIEIGLAYYIEK